MAPSTIPYPDDGQGMSLFTACCPSYPLEPDASASSLQSDIIAHAQAFTPEASSGADHRTQVFACRLVGAPYVRDLSHPRGT